MSMRSSLVQVHAAVVLFGLAGLFGKWLPISPVVIVWGRVAFASLALAAALIASRRGFRIRSARDAGLFLLQGFILALHWVLFFKSIQVSSVAVGLLAYASFPIFTIFLEPLAFRERLDRLNILLAAMCLGGILLIVPRFDITDATVRGLAYGLAAGLTFSVLTLVNRSLTVRYESLEIALGQDLAAVFFLSPFLLASPPPLSGRSYRIAPLSVVPGPRLELSRAGLLHSNGILLNLLGVPGFEYRVESSTNLKDWTTLTNLLCTKAVTECRDAPFGAQGRKFYRALAP